MARPAAPECPVFRPTLHDVNAMSFVEYVEKVVEKTKAFQEAGICRIVAPDGWCGAAAAAAAGRAALLCQTQQGACMHPAAAAVP